MFEYGESSIAKTIYRRVRWEIAKRWLRFHSGVDTIGVTGSVGKTTTKELVGAVLAERFDSVVTPGNLDPIFNLPMTAIKTRGGSKFVAEMGVDEPGQMDLYLELVSPRIGVLTRLTLAHADKDHFGSLEGLVREKSKLIRSLPPYGWVVLNGDDELVRKLAGQTEASVLFVGFGGDNDLQMKNYQMKVKKGKIVSRFSVNYGFGEEKFEINLLGKHNALLAGMAIAVGMVEGMDFKTIRDGLKKVLPVEGRLFPVWSRGRLVIDDTYNASPEAVKAAIDVLLEIDSKGVFVLGDMLELGSKSGRAHFDVGRYLHEQGVRRVGVLGSEVAEVVNGYLESGGDSKNIFKAKDHGELVDWLKSGREAVLVKGSRGMRMDKVVDGLA